MMTLAICIVLIILGSFAQLASMYRFGIIHSVDNQLISLQLDAVVLILVAIAVRVVFG